MDGSMIYDLQKRIVFVLDRGIVDIDESICASGQETRWSSWMPA